MQQQTQQPHGGQQMAGQQTNLSFWDVQTPQERSAIDSITQSIQVCSWCAEQCIREANPSMTECIRLCHDVAELGEVAQVLLPRQSNFGPQILQTFMQAARACAQECAQHQHVHCQDCAQVLDQAVDDVQQYLQSQGGSMQQSGQQFGGQQQLQTDRQFGSM